MVEASNGIIRNGFDRRMFLGTVASAGLLMLPACATIGRLSYIDTVRRLLALSTRNAFARLTEPNGFWDSAVARIYLPEVFGSSGGAIERLLVSETFRNKLQLLLNNIAEDGARRAAPIVTDAIRMIGAEDSLAILRGGQSAATAYLRNAMGGRLVEQMIPALDDAMRIIEDPVLRNGISVLAGADIGEVARSLAYEVDDSIWRQIGHEEAAIRANPEITDDPELIGALTALKAL